MEPSSSTTPLGVSGMSDFGAAGFPARRAAHPFLPRKWMDGARDWEDEDDAVVVVDDSGVTESVAAATGVSVSDPEAVAGASFGAD